MHGDLHHDRLTSLRVNSFLLLNIGRMSQDLDIIPTQQHCKVIIRQPGVLADFRFFGIIPPRFDNAVFHQQTIMRGFVQDAISIVLGHEQVMQIIACLPSALLIVRANRFALNNGTGRRKRPDDAGEHPADHIRYVFGDNL